MKLTSWSITASLVLSTILALFIPVFWIKLPFAIVDLIIICLIYGYLFYKNNNIVGIFTTGYLFLISTITIINGILLFFYQVNYLTNCILFTVLNIGALFFIWHDKIHWQIDAVNYRKYFSGKNITYSFFYILLILSILILIIQIIKSSSDQNIYSVWQVLNSNFLLFYFIIIVAFFALVNIKTSSKYIVLILLFFLVSSVGIIIYKLNYGFDPFIHQATEKIIWQNGFVLPRPIYYLGYYGLINYFQNLWSVSNVLIDRYLVVFHFSLILPLLITQWSILKKYQFWSISPLFLLMIPLQTIALNTPQALANVFILLTIFLALAEDFNYKIHILFLLGLATTLIHPLSGIPLLFFVLFFGINKYVQKSTTKAILNIQALILLTITPSILLLINSFLSYHQLQLRWDYDSFKSIWSALLLPFTKYINNLDFVYLYESWWPVILIVIALFILKRYRTTLLYPHFFAFIGVIGGYVIFKTMISFDFLISYEKNNYSGRLWEIGLLFLIPFILIFYLKLLEKIKKEKFLIFSVIIVISIMITSAFYLSYPRRDQYSYNKLINTSINDFVAVQEIEKHAQYKDYIVLANQAVAAAAVASNGFAHYYQNNFYYPLPTSSPLYNLYLNLAYNQKDLTSVLSEVKNLTGVSRVYFIINDYWTGFDEIVEQHLKTSHWSKNIADKDFIFYYDLPVKSN